MMTARAALAVAMFLCWPLAASAAQAQATTAAGQGTLTDIATDLSGAALSAVVITLTGPLKTSARSGADGRYVFSTLTPGIYQVTAMKAGFSGSRKATLPLSRARSQRSTSRSGNRLLRRYARSVASP